MVQDRRVAFRPFLTRKIFQEILGLEGSNISWEKKNVSVEMKNKQKENCQPCVEDVLAKAKCT